MVENVTNIQDGKFSKYKKLLKKFVGEGSLDVEEFDDSTVKSFNNFLSEGREHCLEIVDKFHEEEIGYLSGWKIWEIHNCIEAENVDLLLELVWVAFEKQMVVTDWHPWDGQFRIEEEGEDLQLWLKGYYRYVARTGNYQGFISAGYNYKHNNQYLSDLKESLTTDDFEAQVLHLCSVISDIFEKNSPSEKDFNFIKNLIRNKKTVTEISKSICWVCSITDIEWANFNIGKAMADNELEFYDT